MSRTSNAAKKLAEYFEIKNTFPFEEPNEEADGNIEITKKISVQVGDDYFIVSKESKPGTFKFLPSRKTISEVIKDIESF